MAKAKKQKLDYRTLPSAVRHRSGCKVGWNYYTDEATAIEASKLARHNAEIDWSLGYDFGYQSPGTVTFVKEGEYAGLWEVCVS